MAYFHSSNRIRSGLLPLTAPSLEAHALSSLASLHNPQLDAGFCRGAPSTIAPRLRFVASDHSKSDDGFIILQQHVHLGDDIPELQCSVCIVHIARISGDDCRDERGVFCACA